MSLHLFEALQEGLQIEEPKHVVAPKPNLGRAEALDVPTVPEVVQIGRSAYCLLRLPSYQRGYRAEIQFLDLH